MRIQKDFYLEEDDWVLSLTEADTDEDAYEVFGWIRVNGNDYDNSESDWVRLTVGSIYET